MRIVTFTVALLHYWFSKMSIHLPSLRFVMSCKSVIQKLLNESPYDLHYCKLELATNSAVGKICNSSPQCRRNSGIEMFNRSLLRILKTAKSDS